MVTIGMNYSVLAGKEDVFESVCCRVIDLMSTDDGHQDSQLFRRVDAPNSSYFRGGLRLAQGMILAASDEDGISVLSPDKDVALGSRVK